MKGLKATYFTSAGSTLNVTVMKFLSVTPSKAVVVDDDGFIYTADLSELEKAREQVRSGILFDATNPLAEVTEKLGKNRALNYGAEL